MKPINILCLIAILFISNSCKKNIQNEGCKNFIPSDTYKYPIQPGTPAWDALQTPDARWQACQIPSNVLQNISTKGLVQSWLDMPLKNEIFMANFLQKGVEYFMENFSGLKELTKRNDSADELFNKFKTMNPACVTSYETEIQQGNFVSLFSYVALLLSQDTIINKMSLEQKKILVSEAIKKYNIQLDYASDFGRKSMEHCLFICAKIMMSCGYKPFLNQLNDDLAWFVKNAQFYTPVADYTNEMRIIISNSLNFIK